MQSPDPSPALSEEGTRCRRGWGRCLPKPQSSGNSRGQGHSSRDTRPLPPVHVQGCTAQWEALRHSVGAGRVSWDKTPLPPFSTFSTLRGPEGQACPLNRQLSATSRVSKCPGPQQHGPMPPRSYTPAVPVPSQKPLGVTLPWGRRLVSSPEMPWAGGFPGVGAHANLGQGAALRPLPRAAGVSRSWPICSVSAGVSSGRRLRGPL